MSSFGAPLDEVWSNQSSFTSRTPPGSNRRCDDAPNAVMNMRACTAGSKSKRKEGKSKRCPPAPPSSPRRPSKRCPDNAPPIWVPTPPSLPAPSPPQDGGMLDFSGASWDTFADTVTPFGYWDPNATFDTPLTLPHANEAELSPVFLSAMPSSSSRPEDLEDSGGDFAASDDDFAADDDDEEDEDEDEDEIVPKKKSSSSSSSSSNKNNPAAPSKLDGTTFAADMTAYVVSGVLLIFVMEQFIQLGLRMGGK